MPPPRQNKIVERVYGFYKILRYCGSLAVGSIEKIGEGGYFRKSDLRGNNCHCELENGASQSHNLCNNINEITTSNASHSPRNGIEDSCKPQVADGTATIHPFSNSIPNGTRGIDFVSLIPSLEGRGNKGVGENQPSPQPSPIGERVSNTLNHGVLHDINFSKRTYSPVHLLSYSLQKLDAFTLAEVLITLGVIGVVAGLTLPTLIANYREKVLVTAAKKSYNTITNAVNMWNEKNGVIGNYEYFWTYHDDTIDLLKELATILNATNVCTYENLNECGGTYQVKKSKKQNDGHGNTSKFTMQNNNRAVLADGSFISILTQAKNGTCVYKIFQYETDSNGNYIKDESSPTGYKGKYGTGNTCGYIGIDTNGLKGPNQIGLDYFTIGFRPQKFWANTDETGNLEYVLANDKLIETEKYSLGKF